MSDGPPSAASPTVLRAPAGRSTHVWLPAPRPRQPQLRLEVPADSLRGSQTRGQPSGGSSAADSACGRGGELLPEAAAASEPGCAPCAAAGRGAPRPSALAGAACALLLLLPLPRKASGGAHRDAGRLRRDCAGQGSRIQLRELTAGPRGAAAHTRAPGAAAQEGASRAPGQERCSSERSSSPGGKAAPAPGPQSFPTGTRGAARQAPEQKLRLRSVGAVS